MREHTTDTADESPDRSNCLRRSMLKAAGITAAIPAFGGVGTARERSTTGQEIPPADTDDARPPVIHSQFGFSGTSRDEIPKRLEPDETVELHVDEDGIVEPEPPDFDLTVEFGAFHFAPVGLQVDPGAIVEFDFHTPEHTATAYHQGQERQQRVPDGVPAFSSTVNEHGGFWLYRFEKEGVYDLFCSPHEWGGMGMRIVVGDDPCDVVRNPAPPGDGGGRPPLPMTAALLGTGLPPDDPDVGPSEMAPRTIVDDGPISVEDLGIDLEVTLTGPTPT